MMRIEVQEEVVQVALRSSGYQPKQSLKPLNKDGDGNQEFDGLNHSLD